MKDRLCLIGLDPPESDAIAKRLEIPVIAHPMVPRIAVDAGRLLVESPTSSRRLPISHLVFHGIFDDDLEFLAALALWGGPCLPSAHGLMDARLRLPCLVRALERSRYAAPPRGFASAGMTISASHEQPRVAKWGNWHCGENKRKLEESWTADQPSLIEPFLPGRAVRIALIGEHAWQIQLAGSDWRESIHHPDARIVEPDPDLVEDTRAVAQHLGLEVAANDYLIGDDGQVHLLEANHVPNVTRFDEIRRAYIDYVVAWAAGS